MQSIRTWLVWLLLVVFHGIGFAAPSDGVDEAGLTYVGALKPEEQKAVEAAIEAGVAYLRRAQTPSGVFGEPVALRKICPVGFTALPGLALLDYGLPAKDPAIQRAVALVRKLAPMESRTYDISLAILFLDRLGEREDVPLIRSLALRLAAGQGPVGAWGYNCPILTPDHEKKLIAALGEYKRDEAKLLLILPKPKAPAERSDNSNTQFAVLALGAARRHDLPLDAVFVKVEQRFRLSQKPKGWGYRFDGYRQNGSMTCVGLIGLACGRAVALEGAAADEGKPIDEGLRQGLTTLAACLKDPSDGRLLSAGGEWWGPNGAVNLYFLWSVERVGVLCNVKTIGGIDWYRWGVDLLLPTQLKDGSWLGRGNGGAPVIDTSMALLFLKRSDLLPEFRNTLQKRLKITDPGASPMDKSPGDKSDPKKGADKKGPIDELNPEARAPLEQSLLWPPLESDHLGISHRDRLDFHCCP